MNTEKEPSNLADRIVRICLWLILSWFSLLIKVLSGISRLLIEATKKVVIEKKGASTRS